MVDASWPEVDPSQRLCVTTSRLVCQVNGKVRARIEVAADADEAMRRSRSRSADDERAEVHGRQDRA